MEREGEKTGAAKEGAGAKQTIIQRLLEEHSASIKRSNDDLAEGLRERVAELERERERFEEEKAEWMAVHAKLQRTSVGSRVKLDVGGKVFATSLTTLLSQRGSFFEAAFGGRFEVKLQEDGCFFIDRDPAV